MKKPLRIALVVVAVGVVAGGVAAASDVPQESKRFKITKGKQFELCRELEEIINLPENKASRASSATLGEITFPTHYHNFKPVDNWQPIPAEKVKEYLYEPETLEALEEQKAMLMFDGLSTLEAEKKAGYSVHKTRDGKSPLIFEKVTLNFDHWPGNGPETIVRVRFPGRSLGTCVLADRDVKKYNDTAFSGRIKRPNGGYYFSGAVNNCQIFTYKDRVYHAIGSTLQQSWQVNVPESSKISNKYKNDLYDTSVCYIE